MTNDELRPYVESVGFEDRLDEAEKLRLYIAGHITCRKGHHRERSKVDEPCPVCGSFVPFEVSGYEA
jgi:hypothetical protein